MNWRLLPMVDIFLQVYFIFLIYFSILSTSGTSSGKPIGETSQGIAKDAAYSSKTPQQRKVSKENLFQIFRFLFYSEISHM
jgi:hypothetical protein